MIDPATQAETDVWYREWTPAGGWGGALVQLYRTTADSTPGRGYNIVLDAAGTAYIVFSETVNGKEARVIQGTGASGLIATFYFDKESGLPAKMVATVAGFGGEDVKQETTYGEYKEFAGIKKATKIESKRDGQKYMTLTVSDFKVLDKVDAKTFTEPE